jgi:raffinose/stachyose/melibiose transport system permease protein
MTTQSPASPVLYRNRRQRREALGHYGLLAPALVLSVTVVLIPAVATLATAFTDWNGVSASPEFIGVRNFTELLGDDLFWMSTMHNVVWTLLFLTIPVIMGMGAAILLLRRPRSRGMYQVIFLLPYVLAAVTNAMVWLNMVYNPIGGLIGYLRGFGLDIGSPLASMETALYGVAAVDIWHYWGFLTVVYLSALRQTPAELVEAATLDGANGWQLFWHIYIPSIRNTIALMYVLIFIFSFLAFDYVYMMTQGGPANSTEMLSTFAYGLAFSTFQFGKAAAVGLIMGVFGLIGSFVYAYFTRKGISR